MDNEENSMAKVEQNLTKKLKVKEVKSPTKEEELLGKLGFDFKDDKIIIDINKTSNFFSQIESELEAKSKEIESKIVNADINITKGIGIEIEGDKIGIDLNKTKNMFQQINGLMKDILLETNSSL